MTKPGFLAPIVVLAAALPGFASAATITFDDIAFPGGNPLAVSFLSTYQGLAWSGGQGSTSWNVSPNDATGWYAGTRQPYSHSGNNFAWNNNGVDLAITVAGGGTFDLASFWVRSWPSSGANATAQAYRNGVLVGSQTFTNNDTYKQVTTAFTGIDRFQITLASPSSLLFDDIVITNITPVPEPAAQALLAAGLGVVLTTAALRRRRAATAAGNA